MKQEDSNLTNAESQLIEILATAAHAFMNSYFGAHTSIDIDRDEPVTTPMTPEWLLYITSLGAPVRTGSRLAMARASVQRIFAAEPVGHALSLPMPPPRAETFGGRFAEMLASFAPAAREQSFWRDAMGDDPREVSLESAQIGAVVMGMSGMSAHAYAEWLADALKDAFEVMFAYRREFGDLMEAICSRRKLAPGEIAEIAGAVWGLGLEGNPDLAAVISYVNGLGDGPGAANPPAGSVEHDAVVDFRERLSLSGWSGNHDASSEGDTAGGAPVARIAAEVPDDQLEPVFYSGAAACVVALYHGRIPECLYAVPSSGIGGFDGMFGPPEDEQSLEGFFDATAPGGEPDDSGFVLDTMLGFTDPVVRLMVERIGPEKLRDGDGLDDFIRLPLIDEALGLLESFRVGETDISLALVEQEIRSLEAFKGAEKGFLIEHGPAEGGGGGQANQLMRTVARIVSAYWAEIESLAHAASEGFHKAISGDGGAEDMLVEPEDIMRIAGAAYRAGQPRNIARGEGG